MANTPYGQIHDNVMPYLAIIEKASQTYKVPVSIIANTIMTESAGDPEAWNPSLGENSRGLMQISERTAQGHPLNIPLMQLGMLFEPAFNIEMGTKYLAFIRDQLKSHFEKGMPEFDKWMVITSSYNQGMGYYSRALDYLQEIKTPHLWPYIEAEVLSPSEGSKRPWPENVKSYAKKVLAGIDPRDLIIGGAGIASIAVVGVLGFLIWNQFGRRKYAV